MNATDELLIERACERLIADSAVFQRSARSGPRLAALYTPDGVVVRPNGQRLEGARRSRPPTPVALLIRSHAICAPICESTSTTPIRLHATTTVLIVSGTRGDDANVTFRAGEFADRFVRTNEGWRIAERRRH